MMKRKKRNLKMVHLFVGAVLAAACSLNVLAADHMASDRISDIRNTKHNFAANDVVQLPNGDTRDVVATSENQVCIFCHTPHGDPQKTAKPFLWNRADPTGGLAVKYTSSSLNIAGGSFALGDKSKMCLSCHDGTVAIGQVDMNGSTSDTNVNTVTTEIGMTGANVDGATGKLNAGNALLGSDFSNDHPVGFLYDNALVGLDDELIDPEAVGYIGVRASRKVTNHNQAVVVAGTDGAAQSDNPVTASTRISVPLEASVTAPTNGQTTFASVSTAGQVECTTCHDPHIRSTNVNENIKFLRLRRFQQTDPDGTNFNLENDINCLACHKKTGWENSVHGSETDASHTFLSAEAAARDISSGKQVWETSCLGCHDTHTVAGAGSLLRQASNGAQELSDIDNSCLTCHSSTGVIDPNSGSVTDIDSVMVTGGHAAANPLFTFMDGAHKLSYDGISGLEEKVVDVNARHAGCSDCHSPHQMQKGLHVNTGLATNNDVSGALVGAVGLDAPSVSAFDPYAAEDSATLKPADKEYEICFRCHSSFGHGAGKIGSAQFSNTVKEFVGSVISAHPVVASGGNTNIIAGLMESPFDTGLNVQTMYCSDCHTNTDDTAAKNGSGTPLSPQGSHNDEVATCETCHVNGQYNFDGVAVPVTSGFACGVGAVTCTAPTTAGNSNNLHIYHASVAIAGDNKNICSNCHVKVSHGWENKALLGNTNDVLSTDTRYYGLVSDADGIKSKIDVMEVSGDWDKGSCGTAGGCH